MSDVHAPGSQLGPGAIFLIFLRLGCTSFGGPVAHLGYFQREFVERRRWVSAETFAEWIALCQLLPGPMSSQIGMTIGWSRGGWRGAVAAWCGFTLPSAALMIALGYALRWAGHLAHAGWVAGLKVAAVAIVAQAVIAMARRLTPDRPRQAIAAAAAIVVLAISSSWIQPLVILAGALAGWAVLKRSDSPSDSTPAALTGQGSAVLGAKEDRTLPRSTALVCLAVFLGLLAVLPLVAWLWPTPTSRAMDAFYRAGALVFGGGHVVLPLLQRLTVTPGWLDQSRFLAGYGAAQALPGPLFAFSAFLGTAGLPGGWTGGLLALFSIYLPAVLVLFAALPFWSSLQRAPAARQLFAGANAAVVGILGAALYSPLCTSTVIWWAPAALAAAAFVALQYFKAPPWLIVILCAAIGLAL